MYDLATELHTVKMPRRKPEFMTLHILTKEARVEVALLRVKTFKSCGTLALAKFGEISCQ